MRLILGSEAGALGILAVTVLAAIFLPPAVPLVALLAVVVPVAWVGIMASRRLRASDGYQPWSLGAVVGFIVGLAVYFVLGIIVFLYNGGALFFVHAEPAPDALIPLWVHMAIAAAYLLVVLSSLFVVVVTWLQRSKLAYRVPTVVLIVGVALLVRVFL